MESDFLKTDIGRSLEWGLWEDLFDSDVIHHHFPLTGFGYPDDATNGSGSVGIAGGVGGGYVRTGTTSGSEALLRLHAKPPGIRPYTFDRRLMFKVDCVIADASAMEGSLTVNQTGWGEDWTDNHIGFYILNDELHISVADGTTHNHSQVETFAAGDTFTLKAKHYPGDRVEFWVNGTYEGELTSNLPSGTMKENGNILTVYLTNDEAVDKRIEPVTELWFLQLED